MAEIPRLSKWQLARIGATAGALSAWNRNLARRYLARELGRMPGLGAKAAQLLSLRLRSENVQPEPLAPEIILRLIAERAPALSREILHLEPQGRVASLGQVHGAELRSGEKVAVKVRFPGIEDSVQEQVGWLLAGLAKAPGKVRESFDREEYEAFLRASFTEELDYDHEADAQ